MNNKFRLIRNKMRGKLVAPLLVVSTISIFGLSSHVKAYSIDEISAVKVNSINNEIEHGVLEASEIINSPKIIELKMQARALKVYENWNLFSEIDYETVLEIVKCLNGYQSAINIEDADAIVTCQIEIMKEYAVTKVNSREQLYDSYSLNVSDLLINKSIAVKDMESYLNGILQDISNSQEYCEAALTDLVKVTCIAPATGDTKGIGLSDGDNSARLLWARLSSAMMEVIGAYDEATMIKMPDSFGRETYFPYKMLTGADIFDQMASVAKRGVNSVYLK